MSADSLWYWKSILLDIYCIGSSENISKTLVILVMFVLILYVYVIVYLIADTMFLIWLDISYLV